MFASFGAERSAGSWTLIVGTVSHREVTIPEARASSGDFAESHEETAVSGRPCWTTDVKK
jgi:hypothetical protein